jgi:hypothetical protein
VLSDLFRHRGDERLDSVHLKTSLLLDDCKRGRGLHHSGNHISGIRLIDGCSRPGEECFIETFINRCTQDTIDMEMQSGTSRLPRICCGKTTSDDAEKQVCSIGLCGVHGVTQDSSGMALPVSFICFQMLPRRPTNPSILTRKVVSFLVYEIFCST